MRLSIKEPIRYIFSIEYVDVFKNIFMKAGNTSKSQSPAYSPNSTETVLKPLLNRGRVSPSQWELHKLNLAVERVAELV